MELIDNNDLLSLLNRPQQISQELKLAKFEGWKCNNYGEKYQDKTHQLSINLCRYLQKYNVSDLNCSHCQEYTLEKTSHVIKSPTYTSTGTREITYNCRYCYHSHQKYKTIPKKVRSSSSSTYRSSSTSSSSNSSSGGGSTGGGGAGGDW